MSTRHRRTNARGGALLAAPWVRAPLLLLRRPSVFLAIVGAVAVLTVAAASGVLFLSTLGTASLHAQSVAACPEDSLPGVTLSVIGPEVHDTTRQGVQAFRASSLPSPYTVGIGSARVQASTVHLYTRDGALDHVHKLTAASGQGVWVPDVFAHEIGVRPGDTITTGTGVRMHVAGIYQDLAPDPFSLANLPRYWCRWSDQIVTTVGSDQAIAAEPINHRQGPVLIADEATLAAASDGEVEISWYAPMSSSTSPLHAFDVALGRAERANEQLSNTSAVVDTHLPAMAAIAHRSQNGVSGSIVPIDVAGIVVSALLVGGAGVFWATSRQREIRLLVARGVAPGPLGFKAVLETAPAAVAGLVAGFFGALYLVRTVGPSAVIGTGAPRTALLLAVACLLIGLALIGVIGALSARDRIVGGRRTWLRFVPWEFGLLALAIWIGLRIRSHSAVNVDHAIVHVSPLTFLFPLLGSTAVLLVAGRLIGAALPRIGRRAQLARIAGYFALRRLAGSRAVVVGLIIGTALPCCLLTYGSTVTATVSGEVQTKYETNLGAPHVLQIFGAHDTLVDVQGHGTAVAIYQSDPMLQDEFAYVLGVDPDTFSRFAFTNDKQRADVAKLHPVPAGRAVPAILVNASPDTDASSLTIRKATLGLDIVARRVVFPGLRNGSRPMIVVDRRALAGVDPDADRLNQIWTSNEQFRAAGQLVRRDGYNVLFELTSSVVVGTTGLLPVTWIFGYLRALAILVGVVAIAGLIFALAARTRRRTVSYVLSRRMGMTKLTHLRSLIIELTLVVGFGWLAGSTAGAGSFGFIYRALDVYPQLPPPAYFGLPGSTLLVTAAVVAVVIVLASMAAHTLAERARPADILRLE